MAVEVIHRGAIATLIPKLHPFQRKAAGSWAVRYEVEFVAAVEAKRGH